MAKSLPIGELSNRTGVNIETIRFYEKQGILPIPTRSESDRRIYDHNDVKRLNFVHRCRGLGFSLKEIMSLLSLVDDGSYTCKQIHDLTLEHAQEVSGKIADLQKMENVLKEMVEHCSKGDVPECPIIDSLFSG
ncbi:MAG TPA: helix-turn-helix domain-containing protein [Gammaproteobacteria bacterium]|jgi:MerR family mercuric resistance operon transcriptional regulator|nr:helix-turn-helix domain-containing protein [Gammaproteobacteria bacterium]|tara:strand:- start:5950 stop:6351 length:402 start_codon:yes stop_codon:yes gene_type:complete